MNEEERMRFLYKKKSVVLKTYDPIFEQGVLEKNFHPIVRKQYHMSQNTRN